LGLVPGVISMRACGMVGGADAGAAGPGASLLSIKARGADTSGGMLALRPGGISGSGAGNGDEVRVGLMGVAVAAAMA